MDKKSYHRSRSGSNLRKLRGRRNHFTEENQKKSDKRVRDTERIGERQRISIERQ